MRGHRSPAASARRHIAYPALVALLVAASGCAAGAEREVPCPAEETPVLQPNEGAAAWQRADSGRARGMVVRPDC